jgi:3',5'-cyclic AMP phosphodiesterase CpdA
MSNNSTPKVRLLHLSDPQFGDLCEAHPVVKDDPSSICRHPFVRSFFEYAKTQTPPHAIVVTGDITTAAKPNEYAQAEAAFRSLANLWGKAVPVLSVPGNHDVSWDIDGLSPADGFGGLRFAPYRLFDHELSSAQNQSGHGYSADSCGDFVSLYQDERMIVVGFNTAACESRNQKPHHGVIRDYQIDRVRTWLRNSRASTETIRVALFHHHLQPLRDPPDWMDVSTATNAQALNDFLEEERFHVALHGHKHKPNLGATGGAHVCHVFGGGAFSVVPSERGGGDLKNFAHWVNIRGSSQNAALGEVESVKCIGHAGKFQWIRPHFNEFPPIARLARALPLDEIKRRLGLLNLAVPQIGALICEDPELAAADPQHLTDAISKLTPERDLVDLDKDVSEWRSYVR